MNQNTPGRATRKTKDTTIVPSSQTKAAFWDGKITTQALIMKNRYVEQEQTSMLHYREVVGG